MSIGQGQALDGVPLSLELWDPSRGLITGTKATGRGLPLRVPADAVTVQGLAAASGIYLGSPCTLWEVYVASNNATGVFCVLVDKATAPVGGTGDVPAIKRVFYLPALNDRRIQFPRPIVFSIGAAWAFVTAVPATTLTLVGSGGNLISEGTYST